MEEVLAHYQGRLKESKGRVKALNHVINYLVLSRVLLFAGGTTAVILLWSTAWLSALIGVVTVALFGVLIKRHLAKKEERTYWKEIGSFYQNEIKGIGGDWSFANNGEEYHVSDHDFAHDIDLFGERSFFQRVNRTSLKGGEELLAKRFLSNDTSQIALYQEANKELKTKEEFIEGFIGYARINDSEVPPLAVKKWLEEYKPTVPLFVGALGKVFSILSIAVITAFAMGFISGYLLSGWLVLGLLLVGVWLKQITQLNSEINKIVSSIKSYGDLLHLIEKEEFIAKVSVNLKKQIINQKSNASGVINELSRGIDLFNNRNNLLVAILGNGFLLWDLQTTTRLQKWLIAHAKEVVKWLDVLYEFDAMISLAVYANNHSNYTYPIVDQEVNIQAKSLGHPLIKQGQCVLNDVTIHPSNFLIITGANMAGKSTFLRTISLAILMTNLGLPVYAEELRIRPQQLITSMRSSDSLLEDESYFFAELKRLKFIIDKLGNESYFIVLDEILKGTNSKDKEEGSRKFVKRLVQMGATGIIATHDLGLCTIDKELHQVNNFYFDAEIENDELHFDYKMKVGVCKNMNASFLLRKMNIVEE